MNHFSWQSDIGLNSFCKLVGNRSNFELAGSSSGLESSPVNGDRSQSIMDLSLTSDFFSSVT